MTSDKTPLRRGRQGPVWAPTHHRGLRACGDLPPSLAAIPGLAAHQGLAPADVPDRCQGPLLPGDAAGLLRYREAQATRTTISLSRT